MRNIQEIFLEFLENVENNEGKFQTQGYIRRFKNWR